MARRRHRCGVGVAESGCSEQRIVADSQTVPLNNRRFAMFDSLSLRTKLLAAIGGGLVLILAVSLAGLGFAWLRLSTDIPPAVQQVQLAEQINRDFRLQVQEWKNVLLRGYDPKMRDKYLTAFKGKSAQVQETAKQLATSVADPKSAELARQFAEAHAGLYDKYLAALEPFAASGYVPRTGDELVRGVDRAPTETLTALVDQMTAVAQQAVEQRSIDARHFIMSAGALLVLIALVLVAGIAWWMQRSVIRPLTMIVDSARQVADGRFDQEVTASSDDEIGELARAMNQVMSSLKRIAEVQAQMAERHRAGELSYRMPVEGFVGAYATMVRDTNDLVADQVQLVETMLGIMKRYAVGDLAPDMAALPGEKSSITAAMNESKVNLTAISDAIRHLVGRASAGDFAARGDADSFQHDFRVMVEGLNSLMGTVERNMTAVSALLGTLSRCDLTGELQTDSGGVFAAMRDDAGEMVSQLTQVISGLKRAADAIHGAAAEITAGNDDLSRRTEQQAASLEETASAMEELTSAVRQNAEHAREASGLATSTCDVATRGGQAVSHLVSTMQDIDTSSRRVAEIIGVIDGIAFQTNILALNAAVEAARAGEQGRGFAVVASEVRALAQRTTSAAREIKQLVETAVETVSAGSQQASSAGTTMDEIVTSVRKVTQIMGDIAEASQQQARGIDEIGRTVTQMDETTQQNAALVEQASSSARSLESQAAALMETVGGFRLRESAMLVRAA